MLKQLRLLAFTFFCLPVSVYSSIYTLEYSGTLTDRYTVGYDFPEYISGTLTFDLAYAANTIPEERYDSIYRPLEGSPDFVTGYVTPNIGLNEDFVIVSNGFGEPDNPMPFWDSFSVYDSSVVDGIQNSLYVSVGVDGLDWLTNDSVTEFNFTGDEMNDRSEAVIFRNFYDIQPGDDISTVWPIYDAYYLLNFAKLTLVNAPEPSPLVLLFIGGLALLLRRQFKRNITLGFAS